MISCIAIIGITSACVLFCGFIIMKKRYEELNELYTEKCHECDVLNIIIEEEFEEAIGKCSTVETNVIELIGEEDGE